MGSQDPDRPARALHEHPGVFMYVNSYVYKYKYKWIYKFFRNI
jgi:hypothetical protein